MRTLRALLISIVLATLALAGGSAALAEYNAIGDWNGSTSGQMTWGQCGDGVTDRVQVTLYRNADQSGQIRKVCLNQGSNYTNGLYLNNFCDDVPGEATAPSGIFCNTAFDDTFNDRTSKIKVIILSGTDAYVRIAEHRDLGGWRYFASGGGVYYYTMTGSESVFNDTISSMRIYYHNPN